MVERIHGMDEVRGSSPLASTLAAAAGLFPRRRRFWRALARPCGGLGGAGDLNFPVIDITVNNQPRRLPDQASVADLVRELGLERRPCAVEVNKAVVPKRRHPDHRLSAGDVVEVVTLVGGG